ncbi:hypothetical protein M089_3336 [Bacteroides ovatus str. 3725 D9 iii]|nr:hypothetical protein M082_3853 [Bacteroides fragilis str. 3725 D9 ii]KDS36725.1 hypothetical protein M089_3336 [Bacteroides ovatus str. 3725 D9 iii]CAG9892474.1 hypothetical protein BOVA514_2363 [Bacteroides ovatus]CAG9895407.1 hypothetical protein BOVA604_2450 [Bacteroides ovatus]CAG9918085.1 hypothetical protein BOVAC16_2659 [Bacteroides ovatus]
MIECYVRKSKWRKIKLICGKTCLLFILELLLPQNKGGD